MKWTRNLESVTFQLLVFLFFGCSTAQPSEASDQPIHPTNPTLLRNLKVPKERGEIRFLHDGSLLYREPITDTGFDGRLELA